MRMLGEGLEVDMDGSIIYLEVIMIRLRLKKELNMEHLIFIKILLVLQLVGDMDKAFL